MFDKIKRYFNLIAKADEKDDAALARFEALQGAFPGDPAFVKAEFDAGRSVAESILAIREKAAADVKAATDEAVKLQAQLAEAKAEIEAQKKAVADVKADAKERPAVVVPGTAETTADPAAAFKSSPDLQAEFGSEEAFLAFTRAMTAGRARILQKSKSE